MGGDRVGLATGASPGGTRSLTQQLLPSLPGEIPHPPPNFPEDTTPSGRGEGPPPPGRPITGTASLMAEAAGRRPPPGPSGGAPGPDPDSAAPAPLRPPPSLISTDARRLPSLSGGSRI